MKFVAFWFTVICGAVWASVAGFEFISHYQSQQMFKNECKKTGATQTTWDVIPMASQNLTTFIPVPRENEEYFCKITGEYIWRAK